MAARVLKDFGIIRSLRSANVMIVCLGSILSAFLLASDSPSRQPGATLYILTVDDAIHEGVFQAFTDGFLVIAQPKERREISFSPETIEGVFSRRADAEAAKADPTWAQKCLGLEPALDEGHMSALLRGEEQIRPREPPPGGSTLEENFFGKPVDKDAADAFQECLREAKEVAKDYRRQGAKALGKRTAELAPMLSGLADEPRLLLDPQLYRPLILNAALTKEILALLHETMPRVGLRDRLRLLRQARDIMAKWERLWVRHEGVLAAAALSESDTQAAKNRLQTLRTAMDVEPIWRPLLWDEQRGMGKKAAAE